MSNASPEKKQSVLKTLAIAGFIGIIIFIAWASIQLVNVLPSAFSSLASLAEGVNQYQSSATAEQTEVESESNIVPINVGSDTSLVVSGSNTVDLSWAKTDTSGTYALSYECVPGLSAVLMTDAEERELECATRYNLGDVETATLSLESLENRYADFRYEIAFLRTDDTEPSGAGTAAITVFNTDIENIQTGTTSTSNDLNGTADDSETGLEGEEVVTTPTVPNPETTPTPTYEQEYVYTIPSSDPNGRTDLGVRFLSTGTIENDRFVQARLEADETGAIQFEVKNYGNKTSEEWRYTVDLPTGGTYVSPEQDPLKPNERAVLTIGFPAADTDAFTFVGTVNGGPESTLINNQFTETIDID